MALHNCAFKEKLQQQSRITVQEGKQLTLIMRQTINFMVRNSILMTPDNYQKWFFLFCYTLEKKLNYSDPELIGLFKEWYDDDEVDEIKYVDGIKRSNVDNENSDHAEKLYMIAKELDSSLVKIADSLSLHNDSIEIHDKAMREEYNSVESNEAIASSLQSILKELQSLREENHTLSNRINSYHKSIQSLTDQLTQAKAEAEIDFLTGLHNRRRFERAANLMLDDLKEKNYPFSMIMLDIDNFKHINDKYGHPVGDAVLKEIAIILKTFLRVNVVTGRLGGEEFAVLLPGVEIEDAKHIAERLRAAIENRIFPHDLKITSSFGTTQTKANDTTETLFKRVDDALYKAKETGKNRVVTV